MKSPLFSARHLLSVLSLFACALCGPALAQERALKNQVLPYGFWNTDSEQIPAALKPGITALTKLVGKIEIRAKADVGKKIKKGDLIGSGTGFVIEPGDTLATAFHVISLWKLNRDKLDLVFFVAGESLTVEKFIDGDDKSDLATLALPKKREAFLKRQKEKPTAGMSVVHLGFPGGTTKLKVTFGVVAKKADETLFLTSPALPGNSGGPTLLVESNGKVDTYLGTVSAISNVYADPDLVGALNVDYMGFNGMNSRTDRIFSIPDPEKNIKVEELEAFIRPKDPLYKASLWNFKLLRGENSLKEAQKRNKLLADGIDKAINHVAGEKEWGQSAKDSSTAFLLELNELYRAEAEALTRLGRPLYHVPLMTEASLKNRVATSSKASEVVAKLEEWKEIIKSAKAQRVERAADDLAKLERTQDPKKMLAYAIAVNKDPKLKNEPAHFNDYFLFVPAIVKIPK